MPRRKKGGAGVGGGGGGTSLPRASFGEDTIANQDFGKAAGDITPSYTGDPSVLSSQPAVDTRNWFDKLTGKPDSAQAINNAYLLQTALQKYGQQLGQQTAMQNVGQVNPDFLAVSNKQPVEHDFNDANFNANTVMPFTGNSLGSQQGNATYAGESGMKDLADKSALQQLVNAQKVTQAGYPAAQKNAQAMYYAGQGINPDQADVLSPPTQAAYTAGRQASAAGSMVQKEKFLAEQPEAYETASKESQNKLAALNDPNFQSSFITGQLAQNLHPAIANAAASRIPVRENETLIDPATDTIYHGRSFFNEQQPAPPTTFPDPKTGKPMVDPKTGIPVMMPSQGHINVPRVSPFYTQKIVGKIPAPSTAPPSEDIPSENKSAVVSRSTQLQAPTNQLDLSMNPDVIPAKTAPQANTVSPANLLLQYLKHKGKSIFDTMTSTSGPTR